MAAAPDGSLSGGAVIAAIKAAGIEYIISVPDIVTSDGLLWPIVRDADLKHIRVCKEDEGVSICTALSYCGKRALLLIQNTGFLDSINAIRAIAVEYDNPLCMMVGLQGKEPGVRPTESNKVSVRIVEPMLDVMGIEHYLLQTTSNAEAIGPAIEAAYREDHPVCFVIGQSPSE